MADRRRLEERRRARAADAFQADVHTLGSLTTGMYDEALRGRQGSDYLPPLCREDMATFVLVAEDVGRVSALWKRVDVGGSVWTRTVGCGRRREPGSGITFSSRPVDPDDHAQVQGGDPLQEGGGAVTILGGEAAVSGIGGSITLHGGVGGQSPSPGGQVTIQGGMASEHLLFVAGWDPIGGAGGMEGLPSHLWGVAYTTWAGKALAAFATARYDHDSPVSFGLVEIEYSRRENVPFHERGDLWDAALGGGSWRRPLKGSDWIVLPDVPWNVLVAWAKAITPAL